ncbi:MAG TPA: response regulator [Bryobacteraceae bacterium]|nr:response regulator [Bryobacteraceae bacterium]
MKEQIRHDKPYVVMVEDNPGDVELLRIALNQQGEPFELAALSDGDAALRFIADQHVRVREPIPCVLLLNVHLPKYGGIEVLAAVRRAPALRHVQVVMLSSGNVRPREEVEIQMWGALFREKPREFSEVLQLAADVLELCKKSLVLA